MPNLYDGDSPRQDATAKLFPVKLTGSAQVSGQWFYAWTEQSFDPATGQYLDMDSPRAGDTTTGPFLVEANNNYVQTPCYAWAYLRGVVGGDLFYEFFWPTPSAAALLPTIQGGPTINLQINSCPIFNGSGVQTGEVVEYLPITFPIGTLIGEAFCVTNPSGCCGGSGSGTGSGSIVTSCCHGVALPTTLCATIIDRNNTVTTCNGSFDLPYDPVQSECGGCVPTWALNTESMSCVTGDCPNHLTLQCLGTGLWNLDCCYGSQAPGRATCEPFRLEFDFPTATVIITAGPCASSAGGGGGGGGPTVSTACCSETPTQLYAHVNDPTNTGCTGTWPMPYDSTGQKWPTGTICTGAGPTNNLTLSCTSSTWQLESDYICGAPFSATCTPNFEVVFHCANGVVITINDNPGGGGGGGGTVSTNCCTELLPASLTYGGTLGSGSQTTPVSISLANTAGTQTWSGSASNVTNPAYSAGVSGAGSTLTVDVTVSCVFTSNNEYQIVLELQLLDSNGNHATVTTYPSHADCTLPEWDYFDTSTISMFTTGYALSATSQSVTS